MSPVTVLAVWTLWGAGSGGQLCSLVRMWRERDSVWQSRRHARAPREYSPGCSPQQATPEGPPEGVPAPAETRRGFPSSSSLIDPLSVPSVQPTEASAVWLGWETDAWVDGGASSCPPRQQEAGSPLATEHGSWSPWLPLGGCCCPRLHPHMQAHGRASETLEGRFEELRIIVNFILLQKKISGGFLFFLPFFPSLVLTRASLNQRTLNP